MANRRRPALRPRRSAFAAAFLSFLFPGLGHFYLGRWLRGALWAVLPILAIAAGAGLVLGPDRTRVLTSLLDPDVLLATLGIIFIDLLYRLAAVIDAWRLARVPGVGPRGARMLSAVGLTAIVIVLAASHVAVSQPVMFAYDTINSFDGEGGDASAVPTIEDLGPEWADILNASIGTTDSAPVTTLAPEIPEEYEWDGKKRLNILLVGIDSGRRGSSTFLTDTMIVVSVDPRTGRLAMISLPRDTVDIPLPRTWKARSVYGASYPSRINTLYTAARIRSDLFPGNDRQRGYKALMGTLSELYDIDIEYYVSVDLRGFRGAVNAIGGVVVDVRTPLLEDGYPTDDGRGKLRLYFPAGLQTMNGQKALAFARSRKSTSDFDRAERQQLLVAAVREQLDIGALLAPGVIEKLTKEIKTHVKTNIPARMIPKLLALASDVKLKGRKSLVLSSARGFSTECNRCEADGQYKLLPNVPRIRAAVKGVFDKKPKSGRQASTSP